MSALVICASSHHGNTRKVADRIAGVLAAPVLAPAEVTEEQIDTADLVGFGSGVYWMAFDPDLVRLVRGLTARPRGTAFVYATSGLPETPLRRYTRALADELTTAGFHVAPEVFHCRGLDTMGPFALVGGMNKGRPSAVDLAAAEGFGRRLARSQP
ncbi:flavodoxin domain-containing protein [Tsukamurella paurometabola]|uniref:Flavodoxin n=1 Tax=Tsukamurella paurometabola TaxID=2061 RepID=A0ABS5N5X4_TSUPA|nr:flavodoxin domain-containing protein [Tsukamurella paurometabola]MBS4099664.1 flavodoxin [Tsukamurella paurometabola]